MNIIFGINMLGHLKITVEKNTSAADINFLWQGITSYDTKQLDLGFTNFSVLLRDELRSIQGGVIAKYRKEYLYLENFWIKPELRNQKYGSKILALAEKEGANQGCTTCTVDTLQFEAEDFYRKNGYECLAEIKDYMMGHSRFVFRKWL